ncbi:MAG: RNA-binding transcriptional accessory protein, partial [Clostridia bacterium]|nr:RNA-binding transcriptional accessory protein [Clostridia bacterium]
MRDIAGILAQELQRPLVHIQNVIKLIDEGSTIPFIARYRKELHGAMDDTQLRELDDRLNQLRTLNSRRDAIITSIENQGKMTQEIL